MTKDEQRTTQQADQGELTDAELEEVSGGAPMTEQAMVDIAKTRQLLLASTVKNIR